MLTTMPITMAAICGWFGQIALAPPKNHVPSPAANPIKVAATELVVEVFNEISHSSIQVCAPSLSPGPSNLTCRNTISPGNRVSRILVAPTRYHATSAQDRSRRFAVARWTTAFRATVVAYTVSIRLSDSQRRHLSNPPCASLLTGHHQLKWTVVFR